MRDIYSQYKTSHKLCDEKGHPFELEGKSMETETPTLSEFPNGKKATVEQISSAKT